MSGFLSVLIRKCKLHPRQRTKQKVEMNSTSSKLLVICFYIQILIFSYTVVVYLRWAKRAANVKKDKNVPSLVFKYEQTEEHNGQLHQKQ